jgi:hypothetical protein
MIAVARIAAAKMKGPELLENLEKHSFAAAAP